LNHDEHIHLVKFFVKHGLQASKEALSAIITKKIDPDDLVQFIELKSSLTVVITLRLITEFEDSRDISVRNDHDIARILPDDKKEQVEIQISDDSTEPSLIPENLITIEPVLKTKGSIADFITHYKARYLKLIQIFTENNQKMISEDKVSLITDFEQLTKLKGKNNEDKTTESEVVIAGMIIDIQESRETAMIYIQGYCKPPLVICRFKKNTFHGKQATELPIGVVIGIKGKFSHHQKGNILTIEAKSIIYPDIGISSDKDKKIPELKNDPLLISLSDLRFIPSTEVNKGLELPTFLDKLISGINQENKNKKTDKITVIIFSGNIIDSTTSNFSVRRQYRHFVDRLIQLDPTITIILVPGETDFTREFLPQPRPHNKYLPELPANIFFLDNPACFSLNGRIILVFHDKNALSVVKQDEEIEHLVKLLRFRHLSPKWQNTSSIVLPSTRDKLVINHEPDIFILSSLNESVAGRYKNIRLLTGTDLSRSNNHEKETYEKTGGITLPVVNLNTLESKIITLSLTKSN